MSLRGQVVRNKYGSQVKFTCSVKVVGCILHNVMQCDVNNAQCSVHLAQCPVNKVPRCVAFKPVHSTARTVEIYLQAHFHTPVWQGAEILSEIWGMFGKFSLLIILICAFQSE